MKRKTTKKATAINWADYLYTVTSLLIFAVGAVLASTVGDSNAEWKRDLEQKHFTTTPLRTMCEPVVTDIP